MPRPTCCRRVAQSPHCKLFKPAGVPISSIQEVILAVDEMEAIRLADLEGMYQEDAAVKMNISRQTFGRIVESARHKVAQALCQGKALRIQGGKVEISSMRNFKCNQCQHSWDLPYGTGRPSNCPKCGGVNFQRVSGVDNSETSFSGCVRRRRRCHRGGRGMRSVSPVNQNETIKGS